MEGQLLTSISMKNTADLDNEDKTACIESYGAGNNYMFLVSLSIYVSMQLFIHSLSHAIIATFLSVVSIYKQVLCCLYLLLISAMVILIVDIKYNYRQLLQFFAFLFVASTI